MSILVIDLGTSSVRASVVNDDSTVTAERSRPTLPDSPVAGLVEFDALGYVTAAIECAREVLSAHGPVDSVGVANQRATTIVWDRRTGEPVAPAQGWQDLRTVGDCLVLAAEGLPLARNQSATKIANILDSVDPDRDRDLCFGTPDSWLIWHLTGGAEHVTDLSNAGSGVCWTPPAPERPRRCWNASPSPRRCCPASSTARARWPPPRSSREHRSSAASRATSRHR
ncbi:MAG: FGGY family carbohydrate kinase [Microthrixaceae bacterium]